MNIFKNKFSIFLTALFFSYHCANLFPITYAKKKTQTPPKTQIQNLKTIKTPKNNNLTKEEMKYYQEKIGSNYKILSNKGASGYWSSAYNLEDKEGNKFILKIPNRQSYKQSWINNQKNIKERIDTYYKEYKGDLKIPHYITIGEDFVIEENLGKQIGQKEFWKSLPQNEVSKFIDDMAEFLNFTHKQEKGPISPIKLDHPQFTLENAYNYLSNTGALNPDDKEMLLELITNFENRDTNDEITCLTHEDIRYQNIVYNNETKKFALVDFDSMDKNHKLYLAFTSRDMVNNGIPHDILSGIIDKYNKISKSKVNKNKIRALYKLGIFYSVVSFVKFKHGIKVGTDILPITTVCRNKFEKNMDSRTIRTEIWPFIKKTFESIDKAFEK